VRLLRTNSDVPIPAQQPHHHITSSLDDSLLCLHNQLWLTDTLAEKVGYVQVSVNTLNSLKCP